MKKLNRPGVITLSILAPASALGVTVGVIATSSPQKQEGIEAVWTQTNEEYETPDIDMVAGQEYTVFANIISEHPTIQTFRTWPCGEFIYSVKVNGTDDTSEWIRYAARSWVGYYRYNGAVESGTVTVTFTAPKTQTAKFQLW